MLLNELSNFDEALFFFTQTGVACGLPLLTSSILMYLGACCTPGIVSPAFLGGLLLARRCTACTAVMIRCRVLLYVSCELLFCAWIVANRSIAQAFAWRNRQPDVMHSPHGAT